MYPRKPKKIILLSDGTGNSSISRDKSNVWRLFQALDLGSDDDSFSEQIAFYDDGVGTSGFKPLMILGGAFGWGLSRNVRELYTELCRHYQPGDKIYIFGFSRGAFTARVLAHFIGICGILDTSKDIPLWPHNLDTTDANRKISLETEGGFKRAVSKAYKSYRKSYWNRSTHFVPMAFSWVGRTIRDKVFRSHILDAPVFKKTFSHDLEASQPGRAPIEFIGVWDTVDAVGLPIDELASALDKYIYPYQFKDQILGNYAEKAAQALAIDDERHTFHPILWDQSSEKDQQRIEQVWFAGVHSNVGGGYPEDDLALVPLSWMMDRVGRDVCGDAGLAFNPDHVEKIKMHGHPTGKIYDSRSGAGIFYRYRPRNIYRLSHSETEEKIVNTGDIVIHHSVLERIRNKNAGYAPAGIPRVFKICEKNGDIVEPKPGDKFFEQFQSTFQRGNLLSRSEDIIAWGRLSYFCTLGVAFALLAFPLFFPAIPGWKIDYSNYGAWSEILNILALGVSYLESFLPQFWTDSWQQHILPFLAIIGLFIAFYAWGQRIKSNVQKLAEAGWAEFKDVKIVAPSQGWAPALSHYIRTNKTALIWTNFTRQKFIPMAFLGAVIVVGMTGLVRTDILPMVAHVDPCLSDKSLAEVDFRKITGAQVVDIDVRSPCIATGIDLEKGASYKVELVTLDPWMDASFPANNRGLAKPFDRFTYPFSVAFPLKRHLSLPWFALTAQVGLESGDTFPINKETFTFEAQSSGRLYFYVNDAINILKLPKQDPKWDIYYKNNVGTASIMVTKVQQ